MTPREILEQVRRFGTQSAVDTPINLPILDEDQALSSLRKWVLEENFAKVKSIISDCICKTLSFYNVKSTEIIINKLANEYTDKILEDIAKELK